MGFLLSENCKISINPGDCINPHFLRYCSKFTKEFKMSEKKFFFQSEGLKIEGLIDNRAGKKALIVTHPHPLYGGDMYSSVVESILQPYSEKGYTTLRFNFRGVGQSEGNCEEGTAMPGDVNGALAYLSDLGKTGIDLAGYSFGAWVTALGLKDYLLAKRIIMVSPPVNFIDFSFMDVTPKIKLIITGSEDELSPPAMIKEMLPLWNPDADFKIIDGADHFYGGKTDIIRKIIRNFLDTNG